METLSNNSEQAPKENIFKKVGRALLSRWEEYANSPYYVAPHSGAAYAMYFAQMERERAEQERLESEERLIEPTELIDWDDETTFERGRE